MTMIAIASAYLAACHWAEGWRPTVRHQSALARYQRVRQFHDEGRVTCDRLILASQRLMEAQFDLNGGRKSRIEAIEAHLRRIDGVLKIEREQPRPSCHGGDVDVAEVEQQREEVEALLAREEGLVRPEAGDGRR